MGWTINYSARSNRQVSKNEIDWIHRHQLKWTKKLNKGSEEYYWEVEVGNKEMQGFTKIHFSENPENDFEVILSALQEIENHMSGWIFSVNDDYYTSNEKPSALGDPKIFLKKVEQSIENTEQEDPIKDMDNYYEDYEIKCGLMVDVVKHFETIQADCKKNEKLKQSVKEIRGISKKLLEAGAPQIFVQKHDPKIYDIFTMILIRLPESIEIRKEVIEELKKLVLEPDNLSLIENHMKYLPIMLKDTEKGTHQITN